MNDDHLFSIEVLNRARECNDGYNEGGEQQGRQTSAGASQQSLQEPVRRDVKNQRPKGTQEALQCLAVPSRIWNERWKHAFENWVQQEDGEEGEDIRDWFEKDGWMKSGTSSATTLST